MRSSSAWRLPIVRRNESRPAPVERARRQRHPHKNRGVSVRKMQRSNHRTPSPALFWNRAEHAGTRSNASPVPLLFPSAWARLHSRQTQSQRRKGPRDHHECSTLNRLLGWTRQARPQNRRAARPLSRSRDLLRGQPHRRRPFQAHARKSGTPQKVHRRNRRKSTLNREPNQP